MVDLPVPSSTSKIQLPSSDMVDTPLLSATGSVLSTKPTSSEYQSNLSHRQSSYSSQVSSLDRSSEKSITLTSCISRLRRVRVDCYGNDILRRVKKEKVPQKITFRDQISPLDSDPDQEKQIIAEVVYVESFKKYNSNTQNNEEGCCSIF